MTTVLAEPRAAADPRAAFDLADRVAFVSGGGGAIGDLAMRGEDGVRFFTQQKMVTERWPEPGRRPALSLVFPGNR